MERIYFLLILIFFQFGAFAQQKEQADYQIQFKSGTYLPQQHYQIDNGDKKAGKGARTAPSKKYVVVQFYELPDKSAHQKIKAAGVELMEYVPNNAYLAFVPSSISAGQLESLGVRSLEAIKTEHKIHPSLAPLISSQAKNDGPLKVVLTVFKEHSLNTLTNDLRILGGHSIKQLSGNLTEVVIPVSQLRQLAQMQGVAFVSPAGPAPVPLSFESAVSSRVNVLRSGVTNTKNLKGEGVSIAVADIFSGKVHADVQNRIINKSTYNSDDPHGDHTSGIIGGNGNLNPFYAGFAPKSTLVFTDMVDNFNNAYTYYHEHKVRITSNSYRGTLTGGEYDYHSKIIDMLSSGGEYDDLLHVVSAANEGPGFRTVADSWSAAKNALVVGAIDQHNEIAYYSSRGPVKDGRLKPEVVVVGTNITSTTPVNRYSSISGTSMATPAVAGIASLLYERYRQLHNNANPDAALVKALLCNTADDIGKPGPDFTHGFGQVNARKAIEALEKGSWFKGTVNAGENISHTLSIPSGATQLKVMLYWNDVEAADNSAVALVNDLDLSVKKDGKVYLPWKLDPSPGKENATAVRGIDKLNNIEQVTLEKPSGTVSITVDGSGLATSSQKYVIVYEIIEPQIVVTYPYGGENLMPGEKVYIRWDHSVAGPFSVDYSADNGSSWKNVATNISANKNYIEWEVPQIVTGQLLVKVSNGSQQGRSAGASSVMEVPKGLIVGDVGSGKRQLRWRKVKGATEYEVYRLGDADKEMRLVATQADTSIVLSNIQTENDWFSIRAKNREGALGRRSVASKAVKFRPADAVDYVAGGLDYSYYEGSWNSMPDFDKLEVVQSGTAEAINPEAVRKRADNYGVRYTGFIKIRQDGVFDFHLYARTEAKIYIGDDLIAKHNIDRDGDDFASGSVAMQAGLHQITMEFYDRDESNPAEFAYLLISGDSFDKREVEASELFRQIENQAPVVSITSPAKDADFTAPAEISITASASDKDGKIAKVEFFEGERKLGESTSSPYSFKWSKVMAGTYSVTARATDDKGAFTTSAPITVRVKEKENEPPVVALSSPAKDADFTAPAEISITASASDKDGKIAKVEFFEGERKLGESTSSPYSFKWSKVMAGTYSVTARATDDKGASTTSAPITVRVKEKENEPPAVAITSPAKGVDFIAPAEISITASASDKDGEIAKVEFFEGERKLGESTSSPYSFKWSKVMAGTYSVTARATDDKGASTTSALITVLVKEKEKENQVPLVKAGSDKEIQLPLNSIILHGVAEDNDGILVEYRWEKLSGPDATLTDARTPQLELSDLTAGTYVFSFSATDNGGATATDEMILTVLPQTIQNIKPRLITEENIAFTLPQDIIMLSAHGSDDDGEIESYLWEKISGPNIEMENENSSTLTLLSIAEGNYLFHVTVTDNVGATASASINLTVYAAPPSNQIPEVSAGSDKTIYLPTNSIHLRGQAIDHDGRFASFLWEKLSGPSVTMSRENTANVQLSNLVEGIYVFRFTATDNDGASASDLLTLNVKASAKISVLGNEDESVKAYPNTFKEYVSLEIQASEFSLYEIRVYDLLGRSWYKMEVAVEPMDKKQIHTIDLSGRNMMEGMYIMQIDNRSRNCRKLLRMMKTL